MSNPIPASSKKLESLPIAKMRVSTRAQRQHNKPGAIALIEEIAANFDPDKLGALTVSERDGVYWVVDGGHRLKALIRMGYEDQQTDCWVYRGLTEKQEADLFLDLNNVRVVSGMDKFKVAVVAGRAEESQIDAIVKELGLSIGTNSTETSIHCIGAIQKVYSFGGTKVLEKTLRIVRDAYGKPGFASRIVEGVGLVVANYENTFSEDQMVAKLSKKLGGVNGLMNQAAVTRATYGVSVPVAVAATVVETYNAGRGGVKLPPWWQKTAELVG